MSGVPAVRLAPSGSLSKLVDHLLDEAPELRDAERQQALSDAILIPALPALEALFLALRADVDAEVRAAQPDAVARTYPLGLCLEITQAVARRIEGLAPAAFHGAAAEGAHVLGDFIAAGGTVRRAWGDLRGRYFQNALVVGALYVDVANDTVVTTKPAVEILPFRDAGFSPIADYAHFARIAGRYWRCRLAPNHVVPELAPFLPFVQIGASGRMRLAVLNNYMMGLTLAEGLRPSEAPLASPAMPPNLFAGLVGALRGGRVLAAASPQEGRAAALARCRELRAMPPRDLADAFLRALALGREVNGRLTRLVAVPETARRLDHRPRLV